MRLASVDWQLEKVFLGKNLMAVPVFEFYV